MAFFGLYGIQALFSISKEATPSVNIPNYSIVTVYPWADPQTIDEQVTAKLEKKLRSISLVKKVTSSSSYNISSIVLEFYPSKKDSDAVNDIKSAIDQTISTLPSDAKTPTVKKVDISWLPVYQFSVAWPYDSSLLSEKVSQLEDDIKSIPGVSDVAIAGDGTKEIKINFRWDKIQSLWLDLWLIVSQLRGAFIKFPWDKKEIDTKLYSFQFSTYDTNLSWLVEQIKDYEILNTNGRSITVSDIADVYYSVKESTKKSFLVSGDTTINAFNFAVSRTPGSDIQLLTANLKKTVEDFHKANPDITTIETQSSEEIINKTYGLFLENFRETGLLVFLVIIVFLGRRSSIIVVVSFLLVYLMNFMFLKATWFTFNNIVSFSLILVLWIMVDNLIVMTQWIAIWLREKKGNMWEAIQFAMKNYASAVFFWTLCTIFIFLPLLFWLTGVVWEYMKSFPVVIDSNLTISLFVSLIWLPVLFTYLYKKNHKIQDAAISPEKEFNVPKSLQILERWWGRFGDLFYRLNKTKARARWVIASFWIVFVGSIMLIPLGFVKVDFLWDADQDNIWINAKYTPWVSVQDNQKYTQELLTDILSYTNENYKGMIEYMTVDIGKVNGVQWWGWDTSNYSSFSLKLVPKADRSLASYTIIERMKSYLDAVKSKYPRVEELWAVQQKWWPGAGKAVGFYLVWDDLDALWKYMATIMPEIKQIKWIYNLSTNVAYTNGKFLYVLDNNKLKQFGVSSNTAITTMLAIKNSSYDPNGILIKDFYDFGKDVVSLRWYLKTKDDLQTLRVGWISLDKLVTKVQLQPELLSIDRSDGNKAIKIEADKDRDAALGDITKKIESIIKEHPLPAGVSYKKAGDVESQDTSWKDLGTSILIGIVLMYLILMILFKNFKYPTSIITSIFLSIWGSLIIIALLWTTFNFPAQLGIFGVLGVWVNQAIIHIEDFKIFYEVQWMSVLDSFRKSIALRFVPIFLTKLTTILGLIILSFKDEIYGWLAVAFIGWLLMSFLITLLYLPTLIRLNSKEVIVHKEESSLA